MINAWGQNPLSVPFPRKYIEQRSFARKVVEETRADIKVATCCDNSNTNLKGTPYTLQSDKAWKEPFTVQGQAMNGRCGTNGLHGFRAIGLRGALSRGCGSSRSVFGGNMGKKKPPCPLSRPLSTKPLPETLNPKPIIVPL